MPQEPNQIERSESERKNVETVLSLMMQGWGANDGVAG